MSDSNCMPPPPLPIPGRRQIFGTGFTPLGLAEVLQRLAQRPSGEPFAYLVTPNAQHVVLLNRAPQTWRPVYEEGAWLSLCDSQVVRWLAGLCGCALPLCTGSDLTAAMLSGMLAPGDALTVIGCEPAVVAQLRALLPGVAIHHHEPPMGYAADEAAVMRCVRFVEEHPARFVFLATGAPRSEALAARIAARGLATGIGLPIGSSLHFVTGARRRAPVPFRRLGLEWLYRLALEPRRMWRRVFVESLPLLRLAAPALARHWLRRGALPEATR